ncbi:hypothetical protein [Cellvibrio sp.]
MMFTFVGLVVLINERAKRADFLWFGEKGVQRRFIPISSTGVIEANA